ncbi:MAG: DNA internalization-related competence protein ComEC/Rec2 [Candidatus Neomarinimicrobiota bacterium]
MLKHFKEIPFIYLASSYIGGLLTGYIFPFPLIAFIFLLVILVILWLQHSHEGFLIVILISCWGYGWSTKSILTVSTLTKFENAAGLHGKKIEIRGTIVDNKIINGRLNLTIKPESTDHTLKDHFNYFVVIDTLSLGYHTDIGDTIYGQGIFEIIKGPRNPGGFDFQSYYSRKNIFGRVRIKDSHQLQIMRSKSLKPMQMIGLIQKGIKNTFELILEHEPSAMLSALILGDRNDLDPELINAFTISGVVHVLAVSGLHVGYVLIVLFIVVKIIRIPWGWNRYFIVAGLFIFVLISGSKPSVIRASTMAALYILAPVFNRKANPWNIISATGFLMLIANPLSLEDIGFQLSFTAVISIMFFHRFITLKMPNVIQPSAISNRPVRYLWSLFLVSISAQLGTLPLIAYHFHQINILAGFSNLIIVPLIGLFLALGFIIIFLGWFPLIGYSIGQTEWALYKIIYHVSNISAGIPWASVKLPEIGLQFILYFIVVLGIIFVYMNSKRKELGLILFCLTVNIFIWNWAVEKRGVDIVFLDVGQGDATIVRFPNGKSMLIDSGPANPWYDTGEKVILPAAKYLGIKRFNWLVLSHPHNDHVGGAVSIIESIPVDTVIDTYSSFQSSTYKYLKSQITKKGISYKKVTAGETNSFGQNTFIQILAPDTSWSKHQLNVNNSSIVLKLFYGEKSFIFMGDLEQDGESELLRSEQYLKSDLIKVGHHGSITSSSKPLINAIQPDFAVISLGNKNKFGHPSTIILNRYREQNVNVFRTDEQGAAWFFSDGKNVEVIEWK